MIKIPPISAKKPAPSNAKTITTIPNTTVSLILYRSMHTAIQSTATTIAIILHEIPQEISDFAILIHAGFSKTKALLLNFLSSLFAVAGVAIVFVFGSSIQSFVPIVIAFAAGGFLYIAGSDLVPELHKTSDLKKSLQQFIAIIIGIGIMFALLAFEI